MPIHFTIRCAKRDGRPALPSFPFQSASAVEHSINHVIREIIFQVIPGYLPGFIGYSQKESC